ncbi:MAG: hypothetical protein WD027_09140 [Gaiellales bacterium]
MAEDERQDPKELQEDAQAYVVEQMRAGADEETIVAGLQERGVERSEARYLVDSVYPEVMRAAEAERYEASALVPAILAALAAAIVGGIIWGLIVVSTDYEIGFAAVGIGLLSGFAVVLATRGRKGFPLQVVAVLSSLLGILVGKYLTYYYLTREAVEDALGAEAADRVSVFDTELMRFFVEDFDVVFGGYDILWAAFAVYSAWRIPRSTGIPIRRSPIGPS